MEGAQDLAIAGQLHYWQVATPSDSSKAYFELTKLRYSFCLSIGTDHLAYFHFLHGHRRNKINAILDEVIDNKLSENRTPFYCVIRYFRFNMQLQQFVCSISVTKTVPSLRVSLFNYHLPLHFNKIGLFCFFSL